MASKSVVIEQFAEQLIAATNEKEAKQVVIQAAQRFGVPAQIMLVRLTQAASRIAERENEMQMVLSVRQLFTKPSNFIPEA